ncbi:hypothetical protein B0H15DRAFT_952154 [Mycena belliarum]|uniref:Uncharacterized protein n=1 Tax=Mycena belliarum TaxID=1033014 RepID=A0AAD6TXY7_9AGAR|nr:hypothetical protein B0H15DRAFT_952154 [Mycena belliae]
MNPTTHNPGFNPPPSYVWDNNTNVYAVRRALVAVPHVLARFSASSSPTTRCAGTSASQSLMPVLPPLLSVPAPPLIRHRPRPLVLIPAALLPSPPLVAPAVSFVPAFTRSSLPCHSIVCYGRHFTASAAPPLAAAAPPRCSSPHPRSFVPALSRPLRCPKSPYSAAYAPRPLPPLRPPHGIPDGLSARHLPHTTLVPAPNRPLARRCGPGTRRRHRASRAPPPQVRNDAILGGSARMSMSGQRRRAAPQVQAVHGRSGSAEHATTTYRALPISLLATQHALLPLRKPKYGPTCTSTSCAVAARNIILAHRLWAPVKRLPEHAAHTPRTRAPPQRRCPTPISVHSPTKSCRRPLSARLRVHRRLPAPARFCAGAPELRAKSSAGAARLLLPHRLVVCPRTPARSSPPCRACCTPACRRRATSLFVPAMPLVRCRRCLVARARRPLACRRCTTSFGRPVLFGCAPARSSPSCSCACHAAALLFVPAVSPHLSAPSFAIPLHSFVQADAQLQQETLERAIQDLAVAVCPVY